MALPATAATMEDIVIDQQGRPLLAGTTTFSECTENGPKMKKQGVIVPAGCGLNDDDLRGALARFAAEGGTGELIDLVAAGNLPAELIAGPRAPRVRPASLLVLRRPLPQLLAAPGSHEEAADALLAEQARLVPDKFALFRGAVKNKRARWNLCIDDFACEPDYASGQGRVIKFADLPLTAAIRAALPRYFGEKAAGLRAEANYYYEKKSGIGFHGDGERRKVIAVRYGRAIPLHYQWFHRGKPVGDRIVVSLAAGELYAMSEVAVGTDWMSSSQLTLRHAAGGDTYLRIAGQ